jgi:two-component system, OmpR family, sensor histidine kinase KdpD
MQHAERSMRPRTAPWSHYGWATVIVAACVATDWLMQGAMSESDLVMVFLMGVLVVARVFELGPALWAAVLSVAAFDVLFVQPRFTFAVEDTRYLITFTVMGGAGVLLAGTTARIRRQAQIEHDRAQRVSALYELSRTLVGAQDQRELCLIATEHMKSAIGMPVQVVLDTDAQNAEREGEGLELPLIGVKGRFGRVVLDALPPTGLEPAQFELLKAHAQQLTVALERAEASEAQRSAELQFEQERMRSSLLSSVSHDLRTPLGVILGATTTLLDKQVTPSIVERLELLRTVHGEATRLTRLLENLLQMTRIEGGALVVEKDWHVPEEVVGSALRRIEPSIGTSEIEVRVAREPSLVEYDGLLIELVLINLLENAAKHTPPGTKIQVVGEQDADAYVFDVRDEGAGIASEDADRVFEKFHRGSEGSAGHGAGLGLAICRAIAKAHGGDVVAVSRAPQRGLSMQLRLPFHPAPVEGVAAVS